MKNIKNFVIMLLMVIVIPLVMALAVPYEIQGENTVPIENPRTEVFDFGKLQDNDLEKLADYYRKTYTDLVNSVEELTEAQLNFKPGPDRWSIAQCVEHIAITAPKLFEFEKAALDASENPERKAEVKMTDADIISSITNRDYKAKASIDLQPATSPSIDVNGRLEELKIHYDEILSYVNRFTMEGLRNRILDAPFGSVDAYQFALFIPGHTARHTLQIEEVKADPGFPNN